MATETTHVRISEDAADELYSIKGRARTYDEVVRGLLEVVDRDELEAQLNEQELEEEDNSAR